MNDKLTDFIEDIEGDNVFTKVLHAFIDYTPSDVSIEDKMIGITNAIRPLVTIYDAEKFYLAENTAIRDYINAFNQIFINHRHLMKYMFKIDKVLPINSANGKIFILKALITRQTNSYIPKFIVKVSLKASSDPLSYEYYIGSTLNNLRINYNVEHFALIYGRFVCGLNPLLDYKLTQSELGSINICDDKYERKTHILYEYVRNRLKCNVKSVEWHTHGFPRRTSCG